MNDDELDRLEARYEAAFNYDIARSPRARQKDRYELVREVPPLIAEVRRRKRVVEAMAGEIAKHRRNAFDRPDAYRHKVGITDTSVLAEYEEKA